MGSDEQLDTSLQRLLAGRSAAERAAELSASAGCDRPVPPRVPGGAAWDEVVLRQRCELLREQCGWDAEAVAPTELDPPPEALRGSIEQQIGWLHLPLGVIGPLRLRGGEAAGDHFVPLATTEGALVASYQRGAWLITRAGGCTALCLTEGVTRVPLFVFEDIGQAGQFLHHLAARRDGIQAVVATTSRYCRFVDVRPHCFGREVALLFEYTTGDAAGQNMVTIATDAVCRWLVADAPVAPQRWYLEANFSGDKKATVQSLTLARGKRTVAETVIPARLVEKMLHTTPRGMVDYLSAAQLGASTAGAVGVQGHVANALTAIFLACGQDAASVAEAAIGQTRFDVTPAGDLYASVHLPNLIVGTVGGGTGLPGTAACLDLLGCRGPGRARAFAEICAATALCGELSISGALASGGFGEAHRRFGRKGATA